MLTYDFEKKGKEPLYEYLYKCIREDILSGKLKSKEKLPSKREMAKNHNISVITVENAYAQLIVEGYIYTEEKKGYFVSEISEQYIDYKKRNENSQKKNNIESKKKEKKKQWFVDFSSNHMVYDNFPFATWSKIMRQTLLDQENTFLTSPAATGVEELRNAIADYLLHFRGLQAKADNIIVGAGTEYLYSIIVQLLGKDSTIALEDPGYKKISKVYESNGVRCLHLPMDKSGIRTEQLVNTNAKAVHISPSHQFPTGRVMPVSRRHNLLGWAVNNNGYIIEDDYDSEFRYRGKPIPSLQSSDDRGKVIYIGTFSKAIAPAIRVSYMVLPETLLEVYRRDCSFYSCTVSRIDQRILNEFIRDGYFERHLNKMRMRYRAKHDQLLEGLEPFQKKFRISGEDAGLHLLLTAKGNVTEKELLDAAAAENVKVYGMSENMVASAADKATVLLGFGSMDEADMKEGLRRLQNAWL